MTKLASSDSTRTPALSGSLCLKRSGRSLPLLLAQVTTQLVADYEEIAAAARFLTRKQPTAAARFPNLFVASRKARTSRAEPVPAPAPTPS